MEIVLFLGLLLIIILIIVTWVKYGNEDVSTTKLLIQIGGIVILIGLFISGAHYTINEVPKVELYEIVEYEHNGVRQQLLPFDGKLMPLRNFTTETGTTAVDYYDTDVWHVKCNIYSLRMVSHRCVVTQKDTVGDK